MDQFQTPWYLGRNGPVSDTMLSGGMDQFQTSWCLVRNGPVSDTMVSGWMDQFQVYGIWWNGPVSECMVSGGIDQFQIPWYLMEWTSFRYHAIWWNGPFQISRFLVDGSSAHVLEHSTYLNTENILKSWLSLWSIDPELVGTDFITFVLKYNIWLWGCH